MAKINSIISEILYEEKSKNLKLLYNIDIFIQNFPEEPEPEAEPEAPVVAPEPEVPEQPQGIGVPEPQGIAASTKEEKGNVLNEETFKSRQRDEIVVPHEKAENIQTLEDLLEFLTDQKQDGKQLINDVVVEIVLSLAGTGEKQVDDVISKGDKIIIDLDVGFGEEDSVGIKVNKLSGSDTATMTIKKDSKILPGPFTTANFNKYLLYYRNAIVD